MEDAVKRIKEKAVNIMNGPHEEISETVHSLLQEIESLETEIDSCRQPQPDMYECYNCEEKFAIKDCLTEEDGDWETGYYTTHLCPKCETGDGDYAFSKERCEEWQAWYEKNKES